MVSLCVAASRASSEIKTSHSMIWCKGTSSIGELWVTPWYFGGVVGGVGVAVVAVVAGAGWSVSDQSERRSGRAGEGGSGWSVTGSLVLSGGQRWSARPGLFFLFPLAGMSGREVVWELQVSLLAVLSEVFV